MSPLNERIARLREESVNAKVKLSQERAKLLTDVYQSEKLKNTSVPVQRALAFKYLMEHVSIPVEEGQLIVGVRGTGANELPTFPEICCHSLEDLETLDTREKNPYSVPDELEELYREEIIPYWEGKTMRERVFDHMSDAWKDAYEAGIFTEFMEQRAPGHTAGGDRIYQKGLLEIQENIAERMDKIDPSDAEATAKREELRAMHTVAEGMMTYVRRYAQKLEKLVEDEGSEKRRKELKKMASICRWVPAHAPRTFWEALQHYWFIHVGVITETNPWDAFNPGRIDQLLYPFYTRDLEEGRLTKKQAKELLEVW